MKIANIDREFLHIFWTTSSPAVWGLICCFRNIMKIIWNVVEHVYRFHWYNKTQKKQREILSMIMINSFNRLQQLKKFIKNSQRRSKIRPFINKCNCKGINYVSRKNDWKKLEKNKAAIALNVLYIKKWRYVLSSF